MRLHKINRKGEIEIIDQPFGSQVVGSRLVQIDISPEELLHAIENDEGSNIITQYLKDLTKHYKKND